MTSDITTAKPLEHDPAREAVDSMRGYSYQILSSVIVWMGLADDQVLFLEGAEDFDVLQGEDALAVQIKDTAGSGNITLRTPSVVSAIEHYWDHRQRNQNRRVTYRYLTTSDVGQEDGNPFGNGVRGLELWRLLKSESDSARRARAITSLKTFLIAENRLSVAILDFLKNASDDQIIDNIVLPIDWVTRADTTTVLIRRIKDQLVVHGQSKGIAATSSESTTGHLYFEAWLAATKTKDRALTRADFIRIFDQHTRMSLPLTTVETLLQRVAGMSTQPPISTNIGPTRTVTSPPPLPPRYYRRLSVLDEIRIAIGRTIAVLYGATGTGKTTAAAAYCLHIPGQWGWIDLRGKDTASIEIQLSMAVVYAEGSSEPLPIVLDDLDASSDPRPFQAALSRLLETQRRRGVGLIVTTAHELPPRICQALGIDPSEAIRMLPFSRDEIAGFLESRGCPDDRRDALAAIIELTTQGHPQLVHARVAALEVDHFPSIRREDFTQTPHEILDVQAEARRLLAKLDPSCRELIYRLSLVAELLDRERLMEIANSPPAISGPGLAIDRLIGPWLEVVQPDIFRISPLVRSAGEAANGSAWAINARRSIAQALLSRRSLTPSDVSEILLQAIAARDGTYIAALSFGLRGADNEAMRAIAKAAFWFTLVAVEPNQQMPNDSPGSLFLARLLQYRIAVANADSEGAKRIATRFDEEFPQASAEASTLLIRFIFLSLMVTFSEEITYSIDELMTRAVQFVALADQLGEALNTGSADDLGPMTGIHGQRDYAIFAGWTFILRVKTTDELIAMIEALEGIDHGFAARIIWALGSSESKSRMVLDQIWLSEHRADRPDWTKYRTAMQRLCSLASRLGVVGLARAAAKIVVRVTDEDLGDSKGALSLFSEFVSALGEYPALLDARARVLSRRGEDREAVLLWKNALPEWQADQDDLAPSYSYRDAALAAARLIDWASAAKFLFEGGKRRTSPEQDFFRAGMLIDAGFAYWKSGDNVRAAGSFGAGIEILDQLQDRATTEPVRSVQRRAGHTLMWVAATQEGKSPKQFSEPPAAFCSNLEPSQDSALTPFDFLVDNLVKFEQNAEAGDALWARYNDRLRFSPFVVVRVTHADVNLRRCLRTLKMDGLLSVTVDIIEGLVLGQEFREKDYGPTEQLPLDAHADLSSAHLNMIRFFLVLGVNAVAARGDLGSLPLKQWRHDATSRGVSAEVAEFLATANALFITHTATAWETLRAPPSGQWSCQDLAAIALSVANDTDPRQMILSHGLLVSHLLAFGKRDLVQDDLARIVCQAWKRLAGRPFLLRNPGQSVPEIEAAIASDLTGLRKVKAVLQAALQAVSLPPGDKARDAINNMPEE